MHGYRRHYLGEETQKVSASKRGLLFFLAIVLLIGGIGCVRLLFGEPVVQDPQAYDPVTLEPVKPEGFFQRVKHFVFAKDVKLEGQRKDRINILLLGQGGPGHDGPYLTDTIIIASIRPSTNELAMISIPRDLLVKIPEHGEQKINHANAFGESVGKDKGPILTQQVIEETFGQPIHYHVRVDFKAFEEMLDEVDGVTVEVDRSFTDTQYPGPNDTYQVVSFHKGLTTMDGETALQFVRSRHGNNGEGSDFARSKRQQKVILALKEKILSFETLANPVRLASILDTLGDHVVTNMQFSDMITFMKMAKDVDTNNIITLSLDSGPQGYLKNGVSAIGAFILEPVEGNFDSINYAIEQIFDAPPEVRIVETPKQEAPQIDKNPIAMQAPLTSDVVEVKNGTWRAGLAARIKKRLADLGYAVSGIGNTNERPYLKSGIYALTDEAKSETLQALKHELNIPLKEIPPLAESGATSTDILIILGEDFVE